MNLHSSDAWTHILSERIQKYQSRTLVSFCMRFGSYYPILRPEFLKLVDAANFVKSPSKYIYRSLNGIQGGLSMFLRVVLKMAQILVPKILSDAVIRFSIKHILTPHFLLVDEQAYKKVKCQYEADSAGIILDVVGEEALSQEEADAYMKSYRYVIEKYGGKVAVKLSSLVAGLSFRSSNYEENKRVLKKRFTEILLCAQEHHVSVTLDAEERFKWCGLIEDVFCETVLEGRFRNMPNIGIALQAYRKDSFSSAERLLAVAKERDCPLTVRVVKGAYWDTEFAIAEQNGWDYPLFEVKEETDKNFDTIVSFFLKHRDFVHLAVGTQNPKSVAHAIVSAGGNLKNFEIQVLYGLGEPMRLALCHEHIPVSVYCPMGDPEKGMAYLVRRIIENTAGNSCLLESM